MKIEERKARGGLPKIHITHGNTKTGIDSFNTMAGSDAHGYNGLIPKTENALEKFAARGIDPAAVLGTCGQDCPGCYAKRSTRYINTCAAWTENTISARRDPVGTVAAVEESYNGNFPAVFRIHDSGDFFSLEYFAAWVELARRHPETNFGAYTKAADIVQAYGLARLPDNLHLSCSPWPGVCGAIGDLPQFHYDDGTRPELASFPHCPAVDRNGKRTGIQCKNCLHCYNAKRGQAWAVYAH